MAITNAKTITYTIDIQDTGFAKVQSSAGKLNFAFKDLGQAIDAISANVDRHTASHGRTANVIKSEIRAVENLRDSFAKSNNEYIIAQKRIQSLENEYRELSNVQDSMAKGLGNVKSATGSASGAVVELGRTISDSNYGFPAMANNFQQLATQMSFLVKEEKGVRGAFKQLGKAMTGAGGVLLLLSVAISLFERMALKARETKEEIKDLNKEFAKSQGTIETFELFAKMLNDSVKGSDEYKLALNKLKEQGFDPLKGSIEDFLEVKRAERDLDIEQEGLKEKQLEALTEEVRLKGEIEKQQAKLSGDIEPETTTYMTVSGIPQTRITKTASEIRSELEAELSALRTQLNFNAVTVEGINSQIRDSFIKTTKELEGNPFIDLFLGKEGKDKDKGLSDEEKKQKDLLALIEDYQYKQLELGAENEQQLLNIKRDAALKEAEELGAGEEELKIIRSYYRNLSFDLFLEDIEKKKAKREKDLKDKEKQEKKEKQKQIKDAKDLSKQLIMIMSERFKEINQIISSVGSAFNSISKISQSYHEGEIQRLQREREFVQNNNSLSESDKLKSLERIKKEEEKAQVRKIKAEQTFLMIQQGVLLAETIMNAKKMIMEQKILALKLATMSAEAGAEINISAATNIAKGQMSIGTFFSQLGVGGGIAFSAAIGGIIATIISAKKQAKNQIASITGKSPTESGGGGTSNIQQPDFNIVGASQQSQLAQTIAQAEQQPIQAYVVADDITTAQQLENNIIQGASLG